MLNAFLFITLVTDGILFLFNLIGPLNYKLCLIDIGIGVPILYALFILREKKDYRLASHLATMILFVGYLAVLMLLKGKNFSMIWSYFFAPFSMIILGARKGLVISLLFLLFALLIAYLGIGSWLNGQWDMPSYVRFSISQIVMLYVIYAITSSNEKAYEKIKAMREREKAQLRLFEKLSITDPLTSLYNRRSLKDLFPKAFANARKEKKQIAYFLLDIDYFKPYNDTYGHHKGDLVLIQIADLLRQTSQYAFRIGGDEFAGIIVANKRSAIKSLAKRLQKQVCALQIRNEQSPVDAYITCSIGLHIIEAEEYDFNQIYQTTDKALYQAKAEGRNCTVFL